VDRVAISVDSAQDYFTVLIPAFAEGVLQSDASGYGFLMAASGIGSLLAAMRLVFGGRPRPIRLATGAMLLGVSSVLLAVDRNFAIALGLMVLIGFGSILMAATGNTTIQLAVPDQLRGRVMSVYTTVFAGSTPFGGLITGAIASGFGAAAAIVLGGLLSLATGLVAIASIRGKTIYARPVRAVGGASGDIIEVGPAGLTRARPRS